MYLPSDIYLSYKVPKVLFFSIDPKPQLFIQKFDPATQLLPQEAIASFKAWEEKEDKALY